MEVSSATQNGAQTPNIGLVIPMFNEASRWNAEYWQGIARMPGIHLVFVDDGSHDETLTLVRDFSQGLERADVLALPSNSGKAEAVRTGLLQLCSQDGINCIGFMDADGAFSARDLDAMRLVFTREVLEGMFDTVWSSRVALSGRDIQRSPRRHYMGRIVSTVLSIGLGEIPYDTQSGLKLFRPSEDFVGTLDEPFRSRWLFDVEIMIRWKRLSGEPLKIFEEPLWSWHDVPGSKVKGKEALRAAREIATVLAEARAQGYRKS